MAKRLEIALNSNNFFDSKRVSETDLKTEQSRNIKTDAAIINNHFGSGVLLKSLEPTIIFDSDELTAEQAALLAVQKLDGTGLTPHNQPMDLTLGTQLSVTLENSSVWGRFTVKVAIIGLDFNGELQIDRFYFHRNGKQVTSKHYAKIISILFNDFKGNDNCSRNWGGRVLIKEANSFEFSLDPTMSSQDLEPNLFWRDFKIADSSISLQQTLQNAIGSEYTVDSLNINSTGLTPKELLVDDVVSQIGEKFLSKTNNIQKITLLLGAEKDNLVSEEDWYDWNGDIVVSLYSLQTSVSCISDNIPNLIIDFDPNYQPIIQISFNQETLKDIGYVLTDVLQPVDFVFNNTKIGKADGIVIDQYYAVTIKRSGAANLGKILVGCGNNFNDDTRLTLFNDVWVDVPEEDLWFQVWTNAAKIADGQAYDQGNGIQIEKTVLDNEIGVLIDNSVDKLSFVNTGENSLNLGIIQAIESFFNTGQGERTGNPIQTLKKFIPQFSFVTESDLSTLQEISDPLIVGGVKDNNPKNNPFLEKIQLYPGLAKGDNFCIINPDADLLSLNLIGSKLIPNADCKSKDYRIFKTTLCTDGYGDLNGDGVIDLEDLARITLLIGEGANLESTQQKIADGEIGLIELLKADLDGDGYITSTDANLLTAYINKEINSFPVGTSFTHLCLQLQQSIGRADGYFDCDGLIRLDGYYGTNIVDPNVLTESELQYDGYGLGIQLQDDSVFTVVPFLAVTYQIIFQPFWESYLVNINDDVRLVPAIFTEQSAIEKFECSPVTELCIDRNLIIPEINVGRNDFFIPDDLYLRGEIKRLDGSFYPVDFELATIILELPVTPLTEANINIFEKLVIGKMKYADCSLVQSIDLALGKVKFGVSLLSFYKNLDGTSDGYEDYGIVIDPQIGCSIDNATGILSLNVSNLAVDNVYQTLVTKIQIQVLLKKSGWKNIQTVVITPDQIAGLVSS